MKYALPKYPAAEVDRAGALLAAGARSEGQLDAVLTVVDNWRASHRWPLFAVRMLLQGRAKRIDPSALVSQRLKRLSSIRAKLVRRQSETMRLSQMQDIGGCRAVVSTIEDVERLAQLFTKGVAKNPRGRHKLVGAPKDYIRSPKPDGYRGIHYTFRYESTAMGNRPYNGHRVEIQLRTQLQHAWATAVETVDTLTGQNLKFSLNSHIGDPDWKRFFALMGSSIARREGRAPVPDTPLEPEALHRELAVVAARIDAVNILQGFTEVVRVHVDEVVPDASDYLLVLNAKDRTVNILVFGADEVGEAEKEYIRLEKLNDSDVQVVQVSVEDISALRKAFPNYYLDTRSFLDAVKFAIEGRDWWLT